MLLHTYVTQRRNVAHVLDRKFVPTRPASRMFTAETWESTTCRLQSAPARPPWGRQQRRRQSPRAAVTLSIPTRDSRVQSALSGAPL